MAKSPYSDEGAGHYSRSHAKFTDVTKRTGSNGQRQFDTKGPPSVPRKQATPIDPDNSYSGPGMSAPLSKGSRRR